MATVGGDDRFGDAEEPGEGAHVVVEGVCFSGRPRTDPAGVGHGAAVDQRRPHPHQQGDVVGGVGLVRGAVGGGEPPVDPVVRPVDLLGCLRRHPPRAEDEPQGSVDGDPQPSDRFTSEPAVVLHRRCHLGMGDAHHQRPLQRECHHRLPDHPAHGAPAAERSIGVEVANREDGVGADLHRRIDAADTPSCRSMWPVPSWFTSLSDACVDPDRWPPPRRSPRSSRHLPRLPETSCGNCRRSTRWSRRRRLRLKRRQPPLPGGRPSRGNG